MVENNKEFTGAVDGVYVVRNAVVGNRPDMIPREQSYLDFLNKVGDSTDNIKVIPNFIGEEEIKDLMSQVEVTNVTSFVSQKDSKGEPTNWMHTYMGLADRFNIIDRVTKEIKDAYGFDNIRAKEPNLHVVRWDEGSALKLHVDDLGYVTDNNIATLIYLNDDYEGGEISFEQHNLSVKPKTGTLLIFPGNLNYAHEVKEVLSGKRYTAPIWFTIV
jgi:hypothetical protein